MQEVILDFQGTDRNESPILMTTLSALTLTFVMIELTCYALIYTYLYTHDTLMFKHTVISIDLYKNRQKRNIMSIAGQFYCFLAELVYIMAITISINFVENYDSVILKEISFVVKIGEFGIFSTIQVLSSTELRLMLLSPVRKFGKLFNFHKQE